MDDVDFHSFRARYAEIAGARAVAPPDRQGFWAARVEGPGRQALEWTSGADAGCWW